MCWMLDTAGTNQCGKYYFLQLFLWKIFETHWHIKSFQIRLCGEEHCSVNDPLKSRNQSITETVALGNGNFVAGDDFPSGIYDVIATGGTGNVSSDCVLAKTYVHKGGLAAVEVVSKRTIKKTRIKLMICGKVRAFFVSA